MNIALEREIAKNMQALKDNSYPGRGIVLGVSQDGLYVVQVYWLMGRSENSRNRVLTAAGDRVFTEAADPTKVKDPSLIIYNAMKENGKTFVVSNGVQTDGLLTDEVEGMGGALDQASSETSFRNAMRGFSFEPDDPNFTPRITGVYSKHWGKDYQCPHLGLHIIRRNKETGLPVRSFHVFENLERGTGACITTYVGDGDPLPSFVGCPLRVLVSGDIWHVADYWWETLNHENRISLAVKFINMYTGKSQVTLVNRYQKV